MASVEQIKALLDTMKTDLTADIETSLQNFATTNFNPLKDEVIKATNALADQGKQIILVKKFCNDMYVGVRNELLATREDWYREQLRQMWVAQSTCILQAVNPDSPTSVEQDDRVLGEEVKNQKFEVEPAGKGRFRVIACQLAGVNGRKAIAFLKQEKDAIEGQLNVKIYPERPRPLYELNKMVRSFAKAFKESNHFKAGTKQPDVSFKKLIVLVNDRPMCPEWVITPNTLFWPDLINVFFSALTSDKPEEISGKGFAYPCAVALYMAGKGFPVPEGN